MTRSNSRSHEGLRQRHDKSNIKFRGHWEEHDHMIDLSITCMMKRGMTTFSIECH